MKKVGSGHKSIILILFLVASTGITAFAFDERDDAAGQLIYNTIKNSLYAGSPTLEQISRWKQAGETMYGTGYTQNNFKDPSDYRYWISINVVFLTDNSIMQKERDMFATDLVGKDSVTGANIYISRNPNDPRNPNLHYVLYKDNVILRMRFSVTVHMEDNQEAINLTLPRYRFFVSEAGRLGLLNTNQ